MNKLHPLHTPEFVAECLRTSGCYPGHRRTGRTTAACLLAIAQAIKTPHKVYFIDEETTTYAQCREILRCAQELVGRMGLEHVHCETRRVGYGSLRPTVVMERRV